MTAARRGKVRHLQATETVARNRESIGSIIGMESIIMDRHLSTALSTTIMALD